MMRHLPEQGVYVPIVAGIILVFSAILALAIDSSNLFRAQLRLQRAVDAAAIGGARLLVDGIKLSEISEKVKQMFEANVQANGLDQGFVKADISVTSTKVAISANADINLWLLNKLSVTSKNKQLVTAKSESEVPQLILGVVADVSGSMGCPSTGTCNCISSPASANNCPAPHKLDKLKEALSSFFEKFREEYDYITLVSFNHAAVVREPIKPEGGFNRTSLINKVNNLVAGGATNNGEGIELAVNEINRVVSPPAKSFKAIILITDGANTTARLRTPSSSIDKLSANPSARSNYDYYLIHQGLAELEFPSSPGNVGARYNGGYLWKAPIVDANGALLPYSQAEVSGCGEVYNFSPAQPETIPMNASSPGDLLLKGFPGICVWPKDYFPSNDELASCSFTGSSSHNCLGYGTCCLKGFSSAKPNQAETLLFPQLPLTVPSMYETFANVAIGESDYARENGITVFTIGLGQAAAEGDDPYQVPIVTESIKSYLLRRIAGDLKGRIGGDPQFPGLPAITSIPPKLQGEYLQSPDSDKLKGFLIEIANKIRYRLVR